MITFIARRRRHLRATSQRFLEEQRTLANVAGRLLIQNATARADDGSRILPNRRATRDALSVAIWVQVLKPFYLGDREPFIGPRPLSPYARLLYDGVAGMVQIEAERQAALVRRLATDDTVIAWLVGSNASSVREMSFASFTQWVDPRGFQLADRIQRMAVEVRSRVGRFLDYHIGRETPVVTMTDRLNAFLTTRPPGTRRQQTPYGQQGAYPAKRLLQHEMMQALGSATVGIGAINPYVRGAQWLLDPTHPKVDHCDVNATGGEEGDGVYPLSELPPFPDHPNCRCGLRAVPVRNPAATTRAIRAEIDGRTPAAAALQGALNAGALTNRILTGEMSV